MCVRVGEAELCCVLLPRSLHGPQKSPEAVRANGRWACVPPGGASKYFVELFNAFGDAGGFDGVVARLEATVDDEVRVC